VFLVAQISLLHMYMLSGSLFINLSHVETSYVGLCVGNNLSNFHACCI